MFYVCLKLTDSTALNFTEPRLNVECKVLLKELIKIVPIVLKNVSKPPKYFKKNIICFITLAIVFSKLSNYIHLVILIH